MARKKLAPFNERLLWLRDNIWQGNQAKMANDLHLPAGTVSNLLRGTRSAGPKVIAAIASYPTINPAWLRTGDGLPLLNSNRPLLNDGVTVPVAIGLLPGSPEKHPSLLTPRREQVPVSYCRSTVYAVEAGSVYDSTELSTLHLRSGDLLIIDTDSLRWEFASNQSSDVLFVVEGGIRYLTLMSMADLSSENLNNREEKGDNRPKSHISKTADSPARERSINPDGFDPSDPPSSIPNVVGPKIRGIAICLVRRL